MTSHGSPASDLVFDLVSIQYHALQGAYNSEKFLQDAQGAGNDEAAQFFRQVQEEDARRAERCHDLLGKLTKEGGIGAQ